MGCTEGTEVNEGDNLSDMTLSTTELVYLASGDALLGDKTVQVTTEGKWTLAGSAPWCSASATEGVGDARVEFVVEPNPGSESRSFAHTFSCDGKVIKLVISQMPSSVLDFESPTTFDVPAAGGPIEITVVATQDMTYKVAEKDKEWITVKVTRAAETSVLSFTVAPNPTFAPRTGGIIFNVEGKEATVTINQSQQTVEVNFAKTQYDVAQAGENITVNYTANVGLVPDLSQTSWITLLSHTPSVALSPGMMVFQIGSATESRMASIPIKSPDGITTYKTLTFTQSDGQGTTIIPDVKFSEWLVAEGYAERTGTANKFVITGAGIAATTFNIAGLGIESLIGIDAFINLTTIDCSNNLLTSLNLSQNASKVTKLNCESNNIKTLNLKGCGTFASMGSTSDNALRITKNCLEEVSLSDDCTVRFTVAGANRLTGKNGIGSSTLKIYARSIPAILCGLVGSLKIIDITDCPACVEFKGGTAVNTLKTIYLTTAHEIELNAHPLMWQKPKDATYVLK